MRIRVRYKDYKLGRTDVKIVGEEDVPPEKPAADADIRQHRRRS